MHEWLRLPNSKAQSQRQLSADLMAEKGGSRTLRGPYDPQTGFEDQRHHRAPSFSIYKSLTLAAALFEVFCLPFVLPFSTGPVPKAAAMSSCPANWQPLPISARAKNAGLAPWDSF